MTLYQALLNDPVTLAVTASVLGLLVGSFLNVVIHRVPLMMEREWIAQCAELASPDAPPETEPDSLNLIHPRSRCPHCGHAISALENIPVLSYVFLRGKCKSCEKPISVRYPAIELLTAALAGAVAAHFGFSFATLAALCLTFALISLTFIDFDTQLLPDSITMPVLWLGLIVNLNATFAPLFDAVIGAVAGYGILWLVYHAFRLMTGKEGMGYGDFKLLAMLGAWLGWQQLPVIILLSSLVGAIIGIVLIGLRGHDKNVPIPFGPYLAIAGWIALMWGEPLRRLYLGQ